MSGSVNTGSSSRRGVNHGYGITASWRELQKRYTRDKAAIESTWRAMEKKEREEMILEAVLDGAIPRDENDRREYYGSLCLEMNLKNLVTGDNLLDMIAMRANTPILDAYVQDLNFVRRLVRTTGLRLRNPGNGVYRFMEEESYGELLTFAPNAPKNVADKILALGRGYAVIKQEEGTLVLDRQSRIYPLLQILTDDIMEHKRELENPDADTPHRKAVDKATVVESLQKLQLDKQPPLRKRKAKPEIKATVQDLQSIAQEQYGTLSDHLQLLRDEPLYLATIADEHYFFTTPDVSFPDEHGSSRIDMMTGAYCNRIVKEVFHDAFEGYGNWKSISALLAAMEEQPAQNSPVTKELWSLCSRELYRARFIFKRMLQADYHFRNLFVRRGTSIQLKGPLIAKDKKDRHRELLITIARTDAREPDVAIANALSEIHDLEEQIPAFRNQLSDQVAASLGDVAVITALMMRLRTLITIPKQPMVIFVKALLERMKALEKAWEPIECNDYAAPINKLKDDGMAAACYGALEEACVKHLNVRLEHLFDDSIEAALSRTIEAMEALERESLHRRCNVPFDPFIEVSSDHKASTEESTSEKREKIKTRGTPAAEYLMQQTFQAAEKPSPSTTEKIPVNVNAAKTLKKLFACGDDAQSSASIPWSAFTAAMASLGFSTEPIWGSVTRFKKSDSEIINIHRPHPGDRFEGFAVLRLRARLTRRFGWRADSFVAKKKK